MASKNRVWIAEKPSAAKDLAAGICLAFGLTSRSERGQCIDLSSGDKILPLAGHLLQTVKPGEYLSPEHAQLERSYAFDRYSEFLPVLPPRLIKEPRSDVKDPKAKGKAKPFAPYLLAEKTLKEAKAKGWDIVNAGDTDREGQLIVDELLRHVGIDPYGPNIYRFGLASNLPQDIADAIQAGLEKNGDPRWRLRGDAAATREFLDFAWGMNLSMVGQVQHKNPRISAGRVQTPVLAMVGSRCQEIENFKPVRYFVPVITLKDGTVMRWNKRPGSEGLPGFDLQGRIVDESLAQQIVQRIAAGLPGRCTAAKVTQHSEKAPLPFSLSSLQATAAKELGLTLEEAGEAAKNLYQKHKAISYIGTDCKFLPTSMHAEAPTLLRALAQIFPKQAPGADSSLVSAAFNDSKLDEHYAIVPTGQMPQGASSDEMGVFRLVARRFISQFYPDYVFRRHKIEAEFGTDQFVAHARQDVRLGWKEVEGQEQSDSHGEAEVEADVERDKDLPEDEVKEISG